MTSTLAAETMSLSSSLDMLSWIRLYWAWVYHPNDAWKHPTETLESLPPAVATATLDKPLIPSSLAATDCKSLYDLVTRTAPPNCQECRTQLQTRAIKEQLAEGVRLRWVHSGAQLADALTKVMESHFLRETLRVGRYKLNDETEVLRDRACTKTRLKWLREGMLRVGVDEAGHEQNFENWKSKIDQRFKISIKTAKLGKNRVCESPFHCSFRLPCGHSSTSKQDPWVSSTDT